MSAAWIVFGVLCALVIYGVVILLVAQCMGVGLGKDDKE